MPRIAFFYYSHQRHGCRVHNFPPYHRSTRERDGNRSRRNDNQGATKAYAEKGARLFAFEVFA